MKWLFTLVSVTQNIRLDFQKSYKTCKEAREKNHGAKRKSKNKKANSDVTQIFALSNREFKRAMISILKTLPEKTGQHECIDE